MTDTGRAAEDNGSDDSPAAPAEAETGPGTLEAPPPAPRLTGSYWAAVVVGLVVLLILLVFILENGQTARVAFFGVHGHLPQGVALLLAAVIGAAFVVLAGAARVLQLRVRAQGHLLRPLRRHSRRTGAPRELDEPRATAGTPPPD